MKKYKQYMVESVIRESADELSCIHIYTADVFDENEYLFRLDHDRKVTRVIDYEAYREMRKKVSDLEKELETGGCYEIN